MHKSQRVKITDLNPHLICVLCSGYLIDATTIIECLHSFCRTCIVKYLENNKYCPICDVQVHKTKPLLNIRSDQTLQDIVYKLVPGLFQNEMCRRRDFYAKHPERKPAGAEESGEVTQFSHIYTADESVSLSLEYYNNNIPYDNIDNNKKEKLETAIRRYFRCPAAVSVTDLQKLIRSKYALTTEHRVDIMYMNDKLCEELTLMDIAYIYLWRRKVPLHLTYRIYKVVKKIKLNDTDTKDVKTDDINNKTLSGHTEWKEVQLQISENGEMYATNIDETKLPDSQPDLLEVKTEGPPDVTVPEIKVPEIPELTPIQPKIEVKEEIKEEPKVEKTDDNEVKLGKHKLETSTDSSESSAKKPNIPIVKPLVKNVQQLSPNHPLKIHSQLIIKPATVTSSAVKLVQTQPKTTMSKMNNNNNNNSMKPPPLNSVDKKHVVTTVANHQPIPKLVTPKTTVQNSQCLEKSVKIPQNCSSPSPISTATTPVPVPTNSAKECEKTIIPLPNIPRYTQAGHSTETTTTTMKLSENSIQKYPISNSSPPVVISNNCIQSSKVSIVPKKPTVKIGTPIGYKTLRDPPKAWNPQISRQTLAKTNVFNVNNGASTSDSSKAENKTQTKPAKFFKMRNNMPRFLGNPASGVKPMFHVRDGDKSPPDAKKAADATKKVENKTNNNNEKTTEKKVEVKKQQSIIKIDPKTLRPISDKPETASCSEVPEMKINQSTVPIFNPLRTQKSQTSPKIDRRSPKSPYLDTSQKSPVERNSPKTNKPLNSPTSKKDKLSLNFTPANPFIPNLTSPNLAPNQFLYSNFPSYDPRVMNNLSAYHNLPFSMYFTQPRLNYPGLASQNMPISPNLMSSLNLEVNKRKNYEIPAMLQLSPTLDMKKSVTNTKTSSSKDCDEKSETKTKSNSNNKPTGTVEKIPEVEADKTSTNKEEIRVKPPESSEINTEVKIIETVAEKVKEPEVVPKENNVKEEKCTKKEDGCEKENPNDTKVPLTVEPVKST